MTISRQGVAYEVVSGGDSERNTQGLVPHEVRFWDNAQRQRDGLGKYTMTAVDGDRASDLMNNFLMQIRTNHQRVVSLTGDLQFPDGYTRHVGGLAIPNVVIDDPKELNKFLRQNRLPVDGYAPFMFPTYAGVNEPLDGMWQHETYTVPLLGQVESNIERYIDVATREAWEGDKRGTTLNLQVGASADDANQLISDGAMAIATTRLFIGDFGGPRDYGARFTGVSGLSGVTIDSATITFMPWTTDTAAFVGDWFAEDAAAPGTFTTTTSDITDRTLTTATQEGDGSDFGDWTNNVAVTFDGDAGGIKGLIQEIADTFDPSTLVLIHIFNSGTGERISDSYDGSTIDAVKLDIVSTAPGGADQEPSLVGGKLVTNSLLLRHLVH